MAEISASMVKELREKTDAPMMECKKALTEADGDLGKAEEILRIKLGNRATKAASRVTAEGVVAVAYRRRRQDRRAGRSQLRDRLRRQERRVPGVRRAPLPSWWRRTIRAMSTRCRACPPTAARSKRCAARSWERSARTWRSGASRAWRRKGRLASYVHGGAKIGVLVDVDGRRRGARKDIAMQIAAAKPVALSPAEVPAEIIERERNIAAAKAAESGKPANIVEKMVEGAVQKCRQGARAARPAVREERQADRRRAAQSPRAPP